MTDDRRSSAERFLDRVRTEKPAISRHQTERVGVLVPLIKGLGELGLRVTKLHGSIYMERGIPDLIVRRDMRMLWIETKAEGRNLSGAQKEFRRREHEAGVPVMVVRPRDLKLKTEECSRFTPTDPAEAAYLLLTFTHDPKRAVEIVELEWS